MRTRCEICGEELILSPTGHQWCADHTCKSGVVVPLSPVLMVQLIETHPRTVCSQKNKSLAVSHKKRMSMPAYA